MDHPKYYVSLTGAVYEIVKVFPAKTARKNTKSMSTFTAQEGELLCRIRGMICANGKPDRVPHTYTVPLRRVRKDKSFDNYWEVHRYLKQKRRQP